MSLPGRFVDTSAGRVFVHRDGSGPPLLLVHGLMMSHWIFRPVLPLLAREREVIAVDLLGFGESDKPHPDRYRYDAAAFAGTLVEVLDALGLGRVDLLGHSMGGSAALALAARRPERVDRLALVCPAIYPLPLHPEHKLMMSRVGPFLWKHLMSRRDFARAWRGRHVRDPGSISDELVDYLWARLNRAGGREAAYAAAMALARLTNNNADPGRVRAPTLLLWPEEDRVVPLGHGKRLVRTIPGARLSVVPVSGHDVFLERPGELMRELSAFLARLSPHVEPLAAAARAAELALAPVVIAPDAKRSAS